MSENAENTHRREMIAILMQRLHEREKQEAILGLSVDPSIVFEIKRLRDKIQKLECQIVESQSYSDQPIFSYLNTKAQEFTRLDGKFVELLSEERSEKSLLDWPSLQVFEWNDTSDDIAEVLPWEKIEKALIRETKKDLYRFSVLDLPKIHKSFWLIGEPGAGKTTTLQVLMLQKVIELKAIGYIDDFFPLLLHASQYDRNYSFIKMAADILKVSTTQIEQWLKEQKIWLLIDGFNEILASEQENARRDLSRLIGVYDARMIVSSRKYAFTRQPLLPVFEILPLTNEMIVDFAAKHSTLSSNIMPLFTKIISKKAPLLELARNPLMLKMLSRVTGDGDLPHNRGQLFRLFTGWIFSREQKLPQTDIHTKERILSGLAFRIREAGKIYAPKLVALDYIQSSLRHWGIEQNALSMFAELLNNGILQINAEEQVFFLHELVLEYFCAVDLVDQYYSSQVSVHKYHNRSKWFETFIMLAGLVDDANQLIIDAAQENVILSARCIAAGAKVAESTIELVIAIAEQKIFQGGNLRNDKGFNLQKEGYVALLEIGSDKSLRIVVKNIAKEMDKFPFAMIITSCERPELVALRLLRFGLTGRKRIFQCLSVFRDNFVGKNVINSEEVAQAESILLDGDIDHRELELIDSIGLSESLKAIAANCVVNIISLQKPNSPIWRRALHFAKNQGFTSSILDLTLAKVSEIKDVDGDSYYSILLVCNVFKEYDVFQELAINSVIKCFDSGLYGLALAYIRIMKMQSSIQLSYISATVHALASQGRLGLLLEYSQLFKENIPDYDSLFDLAIEQVVAKKDIGLLVQLSPSISEYLPKYSSSLVLIIRELLRDDIRVSTIRKYINALGLVNIFQDHGRVTLVNKKGGYGVITSLVSAQMSFFSLERSKIKNKTFAWRSGLLVKYKTVEGRPPKRRALAINIELV